MNKQDHLINMLADFEEEMEFAERLQQSFDSGMRKTWCTQQGENVDTTNEDAENIRRHVASLKIIIGELRAIISQD